MDSRSQARGLAAGTYTSSLSCKAQYTHFSTLLNTWRSPREMPGRDAVPRKRLLRPCYSHKWPQARTHHISHLGAARWAPVASPLLASAAVAVDCGIQPLPAGAAQCGSNSAYVGFEGSLTEMEHDVSGLGRM